MTTQTIAGSAGSATGIGRGFFRIITGIGSFLVAVIAAARAVAVYRRLSELPAEVQADAGLTPDRILAKVFPNQD